MGGETFDQGAWHCRFLEISSSFFSGWWISTWKQTLLHETKFGFMCVPLSAPLAYPAFQKVGLSTDHVVKEGVQKWWINQKSLVEIRAGNYFSYFIP